MEIAYSPCALPGKWQLATCWTAVISLIDGRFSFANFPSHQMCIFMSEYDLHMWGIVGGGWLVVGGLGSETA